MPSPTTIGLFCLAALALLLTPGPAVLYVVARSLSQGRRAGLVSILGLSLGGLCHVLAAVVGLSALLASSALAFSILKYLGAAYLIYLGLRKLRRAEAPPDDAPLAPQPLRQIFAQGIVVNVLNPKTALFFLAFLPQFVELEAGPVATQTLFLGLLFISLGLITDSMYALLAGTLGVWLKGRSRHRLQGAGRYLSGGVYIGLGVATALGGDGKQ
jgi:threonine/homoserine/homoserine lactone efflux protein